jgi:chemotaxis protein MotB
MINECKVMPTRLSANGYGEFRSVATNDTEENMQKNRRVEIVILPCKINKVKAN